MRILKQPQQQSFVKDSFSLLSSKVVVMVLGAVTGIILARVLGPDGRGLLAAVLVIPSMLAGLLKMGVRQSAIHYLGKKTFTTEKLIGSVYTISLMASLLGVLICILLIRQVDNKSFTFWIIALAVSVVPLQITRSYSEGILLGRRLVGVTATLNWMVEVQRLILTIVFVMLLLWGVVGALMAALLCHLMTTLYALLRVGQIGRIHLAWDNHIVRALFSKGVVFALALFVMNLNYKVDILLMEHFCPLSQIGLYTVGVTIAQLTWAMPQGITAVLFSHSANAENADEFSKKVSRLLRVSVILSLGIVIFLVVAAPLIIPLLYGKEFAGSVRVVQFLAPGVFAMLNFKILNQDLAGRGKPGLGLLVSLPGLILNIGLNVILLPIYGAIGAAVASSISYTAVGIGFLLIYSNHCKIAIREIFHYRKSDFSFINIIFGKMKIS